MSREPVKGHMSGMSETYVSSCLKKKEVILGFQYSSLPTDDECIPFFRCSIITFGLTLKGISYYCIFVTF